MNEKVILVEVKPQEAETPSVENAGVMFEHNATALDFQLAEIYLLKTYRYYLEFITVNGILRTAYLKPDAQGHILFSIPQEVTAKMTALAVLNIVEDDANGNVQKLIKAHRVRLYFSNLENSEKRIDANYNFSVNQLLEAIEHGTFQGDQGMKGDKGEKGDPYVLNAVDKQAIADLVNTEHFGLPLYCKTRMQENTFFEDMTDVSDVRQILIFPSNAEQPISNIKLTIGKNVFQKLHTQEQFRRFYEVGIGYRCAFTVPSQKHYRVSKLDIQNNTIYSMFVFNNENITLSHPRSDQSKTLSHDFTTTSTKVELFGEKVGISYAEFQKVLHNDWDGLTLTEIENSTEIRKTFSNPLRYLNDSYKDIYNVLEGKIQRNTASLQITSDMLPTEASYAFQSKAGPLYVYDIYFPDTALYKMDEEACGYVEGMPFIPYYFWDDADVDLALDNGENIEGVCLETYDQMLTIFSKKDLPSLKQQLDAMAAEQKPLTVTYPSERYEEAMDAGISIPNQVQKEYMSLAPYYAAGEVTYTVDISKKTQDLEARIKALENRM